MKGVEMKGLKWYGQAMQMDEDRWPKSTYNCTPPRNQERRRARKLWHEGMIQAMASSGLELEDAQNRQKWHLATVRRTAVK